MSFDYLSGQGSKSASRDYPNLHDLTEVLAVEWVGCQIHELLISLRLLGMGVHLTFSRAISSVTCSGEWSCRNISSAVNSLIRKRSDGCIMSL